jgi:hypothetical protein
MSVAHLFEVGLVLAHIDRLADGHRQIGRAAVGDYLLSLKPILQQLRAERPDLTRSRVKIALFFEGIAAHLEKDTRGPAAPPGAREGCAPFVRAARALAASIRAGHHLPTSTTRGA